MAKVGAQKINTMTKAEARAINRAGLPKGLYLLREVVQREARMNIPGARPALRSLDKTIREFERHGKKG